jgi:uncharacterized protein with HEPN domain
MMFEHYEQQRLIRHGVERNLHTLGEAVIRLQRSDPEAFSLLSASHEIIGLRHRHAHGYSDDIDDEIIWSMAVYSIPLMRREIGALLKEYGDPNREEPQ